MCALKACKGCAFFVFPPEDKYCKYCKCRVIALLEEILKKLETKLLPPPLTQVKEGWEFLNCTYEAEGNNCIKNPSRRQKKTLYGKIEDIYHSPNLYRRTLIIWNIKMIFKIWPLLLDTWMKIRFHKPWIEEEDCTWFAKKKYPASGPKRWKPRWKHAPPRQRGWTLYSALRNKITFGTTDKHSFLLIYIGINNATSPSSKNKRQWEDEGADYFLHSFLVKEYGPGGEKILEMNNWLQRWCPWEWYEFLENRMGFWNRFLANDGVHLTRTGKKCV